MIATGYYAYTEKCWLILNAGGHYVSHGETKKKAIKDCVCYYKTKEEISKEWRKLKRRGCQIVKADVTFEYQII